MFQLELPEDVSIGESNRQIFQPHSAQLELLQPADSRLQRLAGDRLNGHRVRDLPQPPLHQAALKSAEALVSMGLSHSKKAFPTPAKMLAGKSFEALRVA